MWKKQRIMDDKYRYSIGQQDFRTLRKDNAFYIDKTAFVDKIARSRTKCYFLARPRRFGKSLFLSTLKYFFEGRRELFKGLCIDSTDWDWEPYPVLHLDLNTDRFAEPDVLDDVLETQFIDWEEQYGITEKMETYSQRLKTIIKKAHEKTGKQVVILVDEYDKPLVSNLKNSDNFDHYRTQLASLYSNFKSSAEHIRLVFLTGISRFSKLSVFSDLNNLDDISFDDDYADIDIEDTLNGSWDLDDLAGLDLLNADPTALLYQTGYLTISDYDADSNRVRLKVPNEEVRKGLFNNLLDAYLKPKSGTVKSIVDGIKKGIEGGNPDEMMKYLDAYFAGIPYDLKMDSENNFHNAFYILTTLIGIDAKAEVHTSDGRIDLLIETPRFIYVIELKSEQALLQIEEKDYARKFAVDPRRLFKVGVNFSSEKRRIEGWEIAG